MRTARELITWGALSAVFPALICFLTCPLPGAADDSAGDRAASEAVHGQLNVGSPLVDSVTLVDENGTKRVIDRPGRQVSLPAGRYRIEQVALKGDYQVSRFSAGAERWLEITADRPVQLRIDGLVTPAVEITRQGRLLELDYVLKDSSGRAFAGHDRTNPPRFTVYKGDQEIGSGSFEYG